MGRADYLSTFMCRLSRNLGASTSWNPQDLSRPVMGLLYLYLLCEAVYSGNHLRMFWRKIQQKRPSQSPLKTSKLARYSTEPRALCLCRVLVTTTRTTRLLLIHVSKEHSRQTNNQQVSWHVLDHMVPLSYVQAVRDIAHKYIRQITDCECCYAS